jgi:hypothetical protein
MRSFTERRENEKTASPPAAQQEPASPPPPPPPRRATRAPASRCLVALASVGLRTGARPSPGRLPPAAHLPSALCLEQLRSKPCFGGEAPPIGTAAMRAHNHRDLIERGGAAGHY